MTPASMCLRLAAEAAFATNLYVCCVFAGGYGKGVAAVLAGQHIEEPVAIIGLSLIHI